MYIYIYNEPNIDCACRAMANGSQVEYTAKELSQLSNRRFAETTQTASHPPHMAYRDSRL